MVEEEGGVGLFGVDVGWDAWFFVFGVLTVLPEEGAEVVEGEEAEGTGGGEVGGWLGEEVG